MSQQHGIVTIHPERHDHVSQGFSLGGFVLEGVCSSSFDYRRCYCCPEQEGNNGVLKYVQYGTELYRTELTRKTSSLHRVEIINLLTLTIKLRLDLPQERCVISPTPNDSVE
jgi:hypothetical protein